MSGTSTTTTDTIEKTDLGTSDGVSSFLKKFLRKK